MNKYLIKLHIHSPTGSHLSTSCDAQDSKAATDHAIYLANGLTTALGYPVSYRVRKSRKQGSQ